MLRSVARVVIENLEICGDIFAHDVPDLSLCRRAVEAGGD